MIKMHNKANVLGRQIIFKADAQSIPLMYDFIG